MTLLRLVPLAPFAVESIVAGAIRMKLWHVVLGTAIGLLPGTLATTVFGDAASRRRSAAAAASTGGSSAARSRLLAGGAWAVQALVHPHGAKAIRSRRITSAAHGEPDSSLANWRALDAQLGPECLRIASYNVHSCRGTDGRKDAARIARGDRGAGLRHRRPAGSRLPPRLHRAEARHAGDSRPDARAPRRPVRQRAAHAPQGARRAPPRLHLLRPRAAQRARRRPRGQRRDGARDRHAPRAVAGGAPLPGEADPEDAAARRRSASASWCWATSTSGCRSAGRCAG